MISSMNGNGGATHHIRYTLDEMKSIGDNWTVPEGWAVPSAAGVNFPWKPAAPSQPRKTAKPSTKPERVKEARPREVREPARERRIGSGRIVDRDAQWDYRADSNGGNTFFPQPFRNGTSSGQERKRNDPPNPNDWLERRGLPGMFDNLKTRSGGAIRRTQQQYEGEPEWLHAGPTSKFDTVELHGFDETFHEEEEEEAKKRDQSVSSSTPVKEQQQHVTKTEDFSVDKFFRTDADFSGAQSDATKSRFSKWFGKCAPPNYPRAPDHSENRNFSIFNNLDSIMQQSQGAQQFDDNSKKSAPIFSTLGNEVPKNVKDFLQMANMGASGGGERRNDKLVPLKDIEASLRDYTGAEKSLESSQMPQQQMPSEVSNIETDVFRKFIATMPNEQLGAKAAVPPFLINDRSNTTRQFNNMGRWQRPQLSSYVDLLQKILQYGVTQVNRHELLNTREGQEYFQALMRGDISVYNLLYRMKNLCPGRDQEVIIAVLCAFNQASQFAQMTPNGPFTRNAFNTTSGHSMFPAHVGGHNHAGSSQINGGKSQRFPSQRELQLHTQSIMQNALMRKEMEEQLKNFTRGSFALNDSTHHGRQAASSQFPFGFTPTSVLSKMTTDKDAAPPKKESSETSSI